MDELKRIYLILVLLPTISIIMVIGIIVLIAQSSSAEPSIMLTISEFSIPFKEDINYVITSKFGLRIDPFDETETFHDGIDLAVPEGTEIVASLDGVVVEVGYQENGLGNYVYIEHKVNDIIFYTAYGHMEDDSIVVSEKQIISANEKIGLVGQSGKATGIHLHFSIMTPKLKFSKEYLVDPQPIFDIDLIS